jgi:D-alanyl-lipoteichoic acid acyltransferase DltB (MBOAT superfamily)
VIADRISVVVDWAFDGYANLSSLNMFLAVLLFGIQIYCDFSGYSDIAVGSARIMGIELMQNFRRPYFASGFSEFWSRWHISLSTWFKDYVYIPLGGNRKGKARRLLNTLVTFSISGLWHGASFTFIIWGFVHGLFVVIERATKQVKKRSVPRIFLVYIFVNLAWIFFRSENLGQAWDIFNLIFRFDMTFDLKSLGLSTYQLTVMTVSVSMLFLHSLFKELRLKISIPDEITYALLAFIIIFFGYFSSQEFIYFRF